MHISPSLSHSCCLACFLSHTEPTFRQALLRGALSQQSAVILVCMAVDRYMCALHPRRYYQHSSKKVSGMAWGLWVGRRKKGTARSVLSDGKAILLHNFDSLV